MEDDDDVMVLERAAAGDDAALALLYRRHGSVAKTIAFRVLRDHALAEDAVQEGFLALWRTAAEFDRGRASVRAWLCVLVHRRACDLVRRTARRAAADGRSTAAAHSYTTEELMLLRHDRRAVREALERLPSPQRQVVELAYWGGLTQTELAERLDIPVGTVKSRTFEALRQLRQTLADAA